MRASTNSIQAKAEGEKELRENRLRKCVLPSLCLTSNKAEDYYDTRIVRSLR